MAFFPRPSTPSCPAAGRSAVAMGFYAFFPLLIIRFSKRRQPYLLLAIAIWILYTFVVRSLLLSLLSSSAAQQLSPWPQPSSKPGVSLPDLSQSGSCFFARLLPLPPTRSLSVPQPLRTASAGLLAGLQPGGRTDQRRGPTSVLRRCIWAWRLRCKQPCGPGPSWRRCKPSAASPTSSI